MSTPDVDLHALSQGRISGLLSRSDRFKNYIRAIVETFVDVKEAIRSVDLVLDIDNQFGVNLDKIGAIVGQPRRLLGAAPRSFFGFRITEPGDFGRPRGYGDRGQPTWGGAMWSRGRPLTGSALMQDSDYKFAIKARILKNNIRVDGVTAWINRVYAILWLIFPDHAEFPLFIVAGGMQMTICIGRRPNGREFALMLQANIIPVPQGVFLRATCWDDSQAVFGFRGQTVANVATYGDRAYPSRGGRFAERARQNVAG